MGNTASQRSKSVMKKEKEFNEVQSYFKRFVNNYESGNKNELNLEN